MHTAQPVHEPPALCTSPTAATLRGILAFMDNFAFMGPNVENGEIVLRMPLPDHIRLQMVAVRDIGQISAAFLLGAAEAPGGAIEIAGDERTGSQIADAFGEHAGLPARYEALPLQVLGDDADRRRCSAGSRRHPPTRPTSEP